MYHLYSAIIRASGRRQIALIILSLAIAALAAAPLKFQKEIVNELTAKDMHADTLTWLAAGMLGVILLSLSLKWVLGFLSNTLGEDMIRRLRTFIYRTARDKEQKQIDQGTLATTITAEAEDLGKFTGGAIADPLMELGTLVSVIGFVTATQPRLGLIVFMVILPQLIVVLVSQRKVNALVGERVLKLRGAANEITRQETDEVLQSILDDFDSIYETRRKMFLWKLSSKWVISAGNGIGLVAVLFFGGMLVLNGKSDVGTVVAATAGLTRLQGPVTALIAFYRQVSAMTVKYDLLVEVTGEPTADHPLARA